MKRPENQILLYCARTKLDPKTADLIKNLLANERIDWTYLHQAAIQHLQIPLLHKNLSGIPEDLIPRDFFEKLQSDAFHISAWSLFMTDELTKLLSLFKDQNIPVIPFKGPVLAATAYGDLSLRVFTDLDVFVSKRDLTKISELLATKGYSMVHKTETHKQFVLKHKYNLQFLNPEKKVIIEIHWRFTRNKLPFALDEEGLWKRSEQVQLAGVEVSNFCVEDLLILLCVHGVKHRWMRLGWLCDLSEILRVHPDLNWQCLLDAAKQMRVRRILFLGLQLLQDLFDVSVPESVAIPMKQDRMIPLLASNVKEYLFSGDPAGLFEEQDFYMKVREKVQDKIITLLYYMRLDASVWKREKLSRFGNPVLRKR